MLFTNVYVRPVIAADNTVDASIVALATSCTFDPTTLTAAADKEVLTAAELTAPFGVDGSVTKRVIYADAEKTQISGVGSVEVAKANGGAITVTVDGPTTIKATMCSTGTANTSNIGIAKKDGTIIVQDTVTGVVVSAKTITADVTEAGTYRIMSPEDTANKRGARVLSIVVSNSSDETTTVADTTTETTTVADTTAENTTVTEITTETTTAVTTETENNKGIYTVEISNADELYNFASRVNSGETDLNAVLVKDIVINEGTIDENTSDAKVWIPIGNDSYRYEGSFDGQGHTISGLYCVDADATNYYVGLFGYITGGAEVKNTHIINSQINGYRYVGGICGYGDYSDGYTISNCTNAGNVGGGYDVGGICGYSNRGVILDCSNTGTVNGVMEHVGGICGNSQGSTISGCSNRGYVSGYYTGGICGYNQDGAISSCNNTGAVSGSYYVGGICGYNQDGAISSCSNTGTVSGSFDASGVCGYNSGTISNCYYLSGTANYGIGSDSGSGETVAKTAEEYASGEVCYLLNGSVSGGDTWYQTLDTDDYPVLDSSHGKVYIMKVEYCTDGITGIQYNNTGEESTGQGKAHKYINGICAYCGSLELAVYNETTQSYEISNYGQLLYFADIVNSGNTFVNGVLMKDITANEGTITADSTSAMVWTPIGNDSYRYEGSFDGQGHTISGLYFNDISTRYVGLFGYMESSAEVKNTHIVNSYIGGDVYVGGVCGHNYGTISSCSSTGTVSGISYVGGMCGYNYYSSSTISSCSNMGTVSGIAGVGGVCGSNNGTISNCSNIGIISGNSYVGGVCGYERGTISSCYYLSGTASGGIGNGSGEAVEKTAEEYASGEVCYLLNGSISGGDTWYQTLNADDYPVLDSTHDKVYITGRQYCPDKIMGLQYNNTGGELTILNENHRYKANGLCTYCNSAEPAVYNEETKNYEISNYGQLLWFADFVNNGKTSVNAVLMNDIVANEGTVSAESTSAMVWTPIGNNNNIYLGSFDGQGHTISGLYFNDISSDYVGLFGYISNSAKIKNTSIINSYINARWYVGGICGYTYDKSTISNCYNSGTISGRSSVGGICGYNYGTISNSYNTGAVSGSSSVGGICGYNYGTISNCYYLSGTADNGIGRGTAGVAVEKTDEQFASGDVCYLLNGSVSGGDVWYQTLDTDTVPVLDSTHGKVYTAKNELCPEYSEITGYNNTGDTVEVIADTHTYNEEKKCIYCGAVKVAIPSFNEEINAYEISDKDELLWFVSLVNNGDTAANAILTANITINDGTITVESTSADQWTPIGTQAKPYAGSFDGQGYTISGLYANNSAVSYVGLFGATAAGCVIKNINVENSYFCGSDYVGAICGINSGSITKCSSTAALSGNACVGGICGVNDGNISYCYNKVGQVNADDFNVGGICGENTGSINKCYNTASVIISSNGSICGSICGSNYGEITSCYYQNGSATDGIGDGTGDVAEKTEKQFASGEVCYLLNDKKTEDVIFYQAIGKDSVPNFKRISGIVYCAGTTYFNYYIKGDVNGDNIVDNTDAAVILKYLSGIIVENNFTNEYNTTEADYNGDGIVDIQDAIAILGAAKIAD